jgi:uncharacterized protein YdgA (DUF945 family)
MSAMGLVAASFAFWLGGAWHGGRITQDGGEEVGDAI